MSMGIGPSTASPVFTTTTAVVVYAKPALLTNLMLHPGSAAATITVYDNATAASGTILAILQGVANGASITFPFDGSPPRANNGITVALTGAASQAQVYFQPEN